jgi:two-component system phosphate regulon sensor histidine kinase PhoR
MSMQRKRLLWQFFPYFLIVSLLSILAASWYASRSLHRFYVERTASDLEARAQLARSELGGLLKPLDSNGVDALCKQLGRDSGTRITVILPSGEVVGDSDEPPAQMDNHVGRPEIAEALMGRAGSSTRYSKTLQRNMMYVAVPVEKDGAVIGVIRAALALYSVEEPFRALRVELIAGVLFLILLAGIGSFAVSRRLIRPIEEMRQAAERFALGNLSHRVPVPESEELGELAEVLNRLAAELGEKIALLERQRNEQGAMFASMIEGVVAIDESERVINLNPAAERLLGIRSEDVLNRSLQEAVRNSDLHKLVDRAFDTGEPEEGDIVLYNGHERHLLAHVTTLRNTVGRSVGALVVLNDVTRLRKLENLRREFVANVSHELKTPITSIKGFVETLQEGAVNHPEDAQRFLGIIAKHADRLNSIIEDLLSLSRIEQQSDFSQVALETASVRDVLNTAVQLCQPKAAQKDIRITLDSPPALAAKINAPLLEQAVVNLIDNAVKYSNPGKPITLRASADAGAVRISVEDQGCGVPAEHLPRIFERFYRVDKARSRQLGGTGLGLSIVRHIALAHGGSVDVSSVVGQGSTFTITLPTRA